MLNRFELFAFSISGIYRYIQKIEHEELQHFGLRGAYAQYLLAMRRNSAGVTATQLCTYCGKDRAAVSRIVAEMEEKGLVVRVGTGENLYRAKLLLTDYGNEVADHVARRAETAVETVGGDVSEEERTAFYAALLRYAANIERVSKEGIPK